MAAWNCGRDKETLAFISNLFTASGWWFSLLINFFGIQLKLVYMDSSNDRHFTIFGIIVTSAIFIVIIIITIANKYNQTYAAEIFELEEAKVKVGTMSRLLALFGEGCEQKYSTQVKYLDRININDELPIPVYTHPSNQLRQLLSALRDFLSTVLSVKGVHVLEKNEIYVSLAFRFINKGNSVWQWADVDVPKGISIEDLTKPNTTFSHLINGSSNFIFYNSKAQAYAENHYLPDKDDEYEDNKLCGSIACCKIDAKRNDIVFFEAVLCASTYGKRFAQEGDEEIAKSNIKNFVFCEFEKRIRVELCNQFMHELFMDDN